MELLALDSLENVNLENLNLPEEKLELVYSEFNDGKRITLYDIVIAFYKYDIYQGLDYLYENYNEKLCEDSFMESVFLFLAKLGIEEKIDYFYKKSEYAIKNRKTFDKNYKYKHLDEKTIENSCEYSDYYCNPIFDEGLKLLCTKKKVHILKKLYEKGFKASLAQLKVATRTENEEVFYTVFNELNSKLIADYVPKLIEELCYYTKISPIKFLFEKVGADYISEQSLNKCLINIVNGNTKTSKLEMFIYLLNRGASIEYNDFEVIERVYGYGHLDILEYIFEIYPDIDEKDKYDFRKYIDIAMQYDRVEIIDYLIKVYRYNKKGYNFMIDKELLEKYCAQYNKNRKVVEYFISNIYREDREYLMELKYKFLTQRKFQQFINSFLNNIN